ncbi:hypothetical protein [Xanthomonas arboricola]|uniref:hypothetical protein n=1 Tax=Xanthomonas arboricola TaxID=56448 RepID=UPI0011AFFA0B|nr:hypothetical protein [Xanthomonas arboricola]
MFDVREIEKFLLSAGIPVSGSAIRDVEEGSRYYAFVEVRRDPRGRQEPSNAVLDAAGATLRESGIFVDFVLADGTMRDAEAGLRATLLHSFGGAIRNSFLSSTTRDAFVWIVPKRQLGDVELDAISAKAKVFLSEVGLTLKSLTTTTGENLPSNTRCLAMLRRVAPATSLKLTQLLREKGFVVPSEDWMTRRLDALRKAGMVIRMKSGNYAISLQALKALGTSKHGRDSPDVSRLLALASKHG